MGDKLTVRVARADLVKKQLDFALVDSKKPEVNVDKNGNLVKPQDSASKGAKKRRKRKVGNEVAPSCRCGDGDNAKEKEL